ncbi:ABC transporter ATP-binding protein, partial [Nocardioides sp. P5_C9_2]
MLLKLEDVVLNYGKIEALHGISLEVAEGEVVALIGANGAGKTSTMRAISGVRGLHSGSIVFDGEDVTKLRADQRMRKGLCLTPEGRGVFPGMTVTENLDMGAYARKDKAGIAEDFERVFGLFPR